MTYNLIYPNLNFAHKIEESNNYVEAFEKHFHLIYEMLYFVSGDVELVLENKVFHLNPGDLIFIKPGQHHHVVPNHQKTYERYVIKFPEYKIPKNLLELLKNKPTRTSINKIPLAELFKSIDWHYSTYQGQNLPLILESVLIEILTYFCSIEEEKDNHASIYNHKMTEIIAYINENIANPLQIEDICQHFHYSKSYIYKEFKLAMDVPIKQYIIAKKILLAESLIQNGHKPIEIYEKCGFVDYSTFYRNYIKIIGKAPSLGGSKTLPISDAEQN